MSGGGLFWMNGRLASGLVEISHDPAVLSDGQFWAVSTTFEGEFTAARFSKVTDAPFPSVEWDKLCLLYTSSEPTRPY